MTGRRNVQPDETLVYREAVWLGRTPTGQQLATMPLEWFHQAIDQLVAETVPETYWRKVRAKREAEAWEVR